MPKIDELVDGGRIQDTDNIPVGRGGDTRRVRVGSAAEADIVGTVSESSGVPTGAIIEQGSNSNGEYTKFADGTMMCWLVELTLNQQNSNRLRNGWNYPAAFSSTPSLSVVVSDENVPMPVTDLSGPRVPLSDASGATIDVYDGSSSLVSGDTLFVDVIALGRWF